MKFYPMPPTFAEWIRTRLKERYTEREAEEKFEEINSLYEQFVARSPDIGGKKNPMSKNLYGAFSAFAYYECTGRSMSPEEITDMCYSSHLTRCRCVWCFLGYYPRFCCGGGMSCCIIFTGALE